MSTSWPIPTRSLTFPAISHPSPWSLYPFVTRHDITGCDRRAGMYDGALWASPCRAATEPVCGRVPVWLSWRVHAGAGPGVAERLVITHRSERTFAAPVSGGGPALHLDRRVSGLDRCRADDIPTV